VLVIAALTLVGKLSCSIVVVTDSHFYMNFSIQNNSDFFVTDFSNYSYED